jgi:hypothetical protein
MKHAWRWLAGGAALALPAVALVVLAFVSPPAPVPNEGDKAPVVPSHLATGWVSDPDAVEQVARALPERYFRTTEAGREGDIPTDVFLWETCRKVTGDLLPARNQGQVGSCVSFGTASAVEHLQCVQIALGSPEEYRDLAQEVIYGGSRVQVGKGRIRGDGSVGAWAAKFVKDWGVVSRGRYPGYDLSAYSESICRQFGNAGCPAALETVAREHPVKAIAQVKTTEEARRALASGYPIAVCSNQGFGSTRDEEGFARAQGSWAHCMAIVGYQTSGPRKGFFILNSWGTGWIKGPTGKGNPSPAGFWAEESVVARMLAADDSWAFSDVKGFPARRIDWFAMKPPVRIDKGEKPR